MRLSEGRRSLVVLAGRGEQQALGIEVVDNGEVLLALAKAVSSTPIQLSLPMSCLRRASVTQGSIQPQSGFVTRAQHPSGLAHGQALAHREGERLEARRGFAGPRQRARRRAPLLPCTNAPCPPSRDRCRQPAKIVDAGHPALLNMRRARISAPAS